jgi:peptidoglycan-associated lipoprotein
MLIDGAGAERAGRPRAPVPEHHHCSRAGVAVDECHFAVDAIPHTVRASRTACTHDEGGVNRPKFAVTLTLAASDDMRLIQSLTLTCAAVLLAACASTPLEEKPAAPAAPVTTAPAAPPPAAAKPVAPAAAAQYDPLKDPNSPLAKRSVYFDFDQFEVKPEYYGLLEAHGKYLADHKSQRVVIEGNADERGSREYNLALGQRRADAVKARLQLIGASGAQIETISYGEERPRATGHDEKSWAENRRADIVYR